MKLTRKEKQGMKLRETKYVSRWNMNEQLREYDALDDVYSSNYFIVPNVKKHFQQFAKAAKKQPKTHDLLRMTFLLSEKYRCIKPLKSPKHQDQKSIKQEEDKTGRKVRKINKQSSLERIRYDSDNEAQKEKKNQSTNKLPRVNKHKAFYSSFNQQTCDQEFIEKQEFDKFLEKIKSEKEGLVLSEGERKKGKAKRS